MNASSVSSYSSDLWEEYLEQLKKQQLQESAATTQASSAAGKKASAPGLSPDQILSELLELQDDPEQLKERAAALAAEVTEEAGSAVGMRADMLSELAGDLETVAESGDLSVIQEKLARRHGGPGGAANIAAKLAEASLEEDEDDDETSASTLESIKALLAEIQKLIEKEERADDAAQAEPGHLTPEGILSELEGLQETPETLKARASELASQLYSEAEGASGPRARIIAALASDLETVAESGDLSALEEKIERKPPRASFAATPSGTESATGFEGLVSKFQSIRESSTAETSGASSLAGDSGIQSSIDSLLEKVKSNLTGQLQAMYTQAKGYSSSVSLSG